MSSEFPHELIRQVQICSRKSAGLPDYNPHDPTLPSIPSLSSYISSSEPSELRCKNCKGKLLRGLDSIICMYCGQAPQNDAVPDPICFTSTSGYRWLLRSLNLDGSEMVEPLTRKNEQDQGHQGQSSPKDLIPLSDFLNLKIPWMPQMEKQETSVSIELSQESKRTLILPGLAPDNFLFKLKRDVLSDTSNEQPIKDVATLDNQNLFQNNQSAELAGSSSKDMPGEAFSGWDADFQSADSENQPFGDESFGDFTGPTPDFGSKTKDSQTFDDPSSENKLWDSQPFDDPRSENKLWDSQSTDHSTGLEVDFASHIDSVFGSGNDLIDEKPKGITEASPPFDDFSSDDVWNNLSGGSHFAKGTDEKPKVIPEASPLFDDFNSDDAWNNLSSGSHFAKGIDEKPKDNMEASPPVDDWNSDDVWNNLSNGPHFAKGIDATTSANDDNKLEQTNDLSTNDVLFQDFQWQTNNADMTENKTTNEDSFGEWNDFTGSSSLQVASSNDWIDSDYQVSTSDKKSSEMDLFGLDSKLEERDFGDFSQPNLFSTSTSNDNVITEVNVVSSENPAFWLNDASNPTVDSGQSSKNDDGTGKSPEAKNDVTMLIFQMHDLSFMLNSNLSIPSTSNDHHSSSKD